jgi:predicted XRE-type DNA-binding protein
MVMVTVGSAAIQRLRSDVALQLARCTQQMGVTQSVAAKRLGLPQPTLSKIINGRVADLSLELLLRVAVRAGLPITLQTGLVPEEAGACSSRTRSRSSAERSDSRHFSNTASWCAPARGRQCR